MPTTSNFGWTTPADTDLVKDGAAAIRTLGNGIDTSLVDLKGGTTGQILSKASNTDLDYTWIANDQGDITEVQAGTGISVASGTGPVPVVTNTVATTFDAKGDLVAGTGADTFAKLTVGANDTVLTADSSTATGLKWSAPVSGGMTLINTGGTTLTGASTTVSSIPSGYRNLHIVIVNFDPATDNDRLTLQINGDGGANRYRTLDFNNPANTNTTFNGDRFYIGQTADDGTNTGITWIDIYEYDNTSIWKMISYASVNNDWTTPTNLSDQWGQGYYNQTTAITSLKFACQTGNLNAGTVYVYGVK